MVLFLIGAGLLAIGIQRYRREILPDSSRRLHGTVTEEKTQRSHRGGRQRLFYAPQASYQHPLSGEPSEYIPDRFSNHRYQPGDRIELLFNPETGEVEHRSPKPIWDVAIPFIVGIGCIILGFFAI